MADFVASELHLKMSKKIAQLTKVIFHLNTRNEDFQSEVAHLRAVHAAELQQLTQDATTKLRALTEQAQLHKDQAARVEARAAQDKQRFLVDLADFQRQEQARREAVQQDVDRRVRMLEEQVAQSRAAFVERIQQLTVLAETQQQALQAERQQRDTQADSEAEALRARHAQDVMQLRAQHSEELAHTVTSANAKYMTMLAEQLQQQDALKKELALATARHTQINDSARQQWEAQLVTQQEEARQRLDEVKTTLVGKMEGLLSEAESLRGQHEALRGEKEALLQQAQLAQQQLRALQLQVSSAQQEAVSVRQDASVNVQTLQDKLVRSGEQVAQLQQELAALRTTVGARDAALQLAAKDKEALQLELLQHSVEGSERHAQLGRAMQAKDLELATLAADKRALQEQLREMEKKLVQLQEQLERREKEISKAQQMAATAELQRGKASAESAQQVGKLTQQLTEAQVINTRLEKQQKENTVAIEMERAEWRTQKEALVGETSRLESKLRELEGSLVQREQSASGAMAKAMADAADAHAQQLSALQTKSEATEAALRGELGRLQLKLEELQTMLSEAKKELAAMTATSTASSTRAAQAEAALAKMTAERDTAMASGKQSQRERDEEAKKKLAGVKHEHEATVARLLSESKRLAEDHKQTLRQLALQHAEQVAALQRDGDVLHTEQLASQHAELSTSFQAQLAEKQQSLDALQEEMARALTQAREREGNAVEMRRMDHEQFQGQWDREAQRQRQERCEAELAHASAMAKALSRHEKELAQMRDTLVTERATAERQQHDRHEQRVAALVATHAAELEALRGQHAADTESLQRSLEAQRHSEALRLRTEMAQRLQEQANSKDQAHATATEGLTQAHATEVTQLTAQAQQLSQSLASCTSERDAAQREAQRLDALLRDKMAEAAAQLAALERHNREQVETLKDAARRDMNRLLEENLAETRQLSEQFEESRLLLLEQVAALQHAVSEWEHRYQRRESRHEDVARIAELERGVAERDALVKRTRDEMAYLKRELLNREEMYNKTFARTPNVGVLNVLKPQVLQQHAQQQQQQHVQMQMQMQMQQAMAPQSKRRVKPSTPSSTSSGGGPDLHRRGSSSSNSGEPKKALPPLNSNQLAT